MHYQINRHTSYQRVRETEIRLKHHTIFNAYRLFFFFIHFGVDLDISRGSMNIRFAYITPRRVETHTKSKDYNRNGAPKCDGYLN